MSLTNCARCGGEHKGIIWEKFLRPMTAGDLTWSHWAACPTTNQPILMYVVPSRAMPQEEPVSDEWYNTPARSGL